MGVSKAGRTSADQITKASGSNLALSFFALSPERRQDITTFYAFCRVIDDIADEPSVESRQKQMSLDLWRVWIETRGEGEPVLAGALRKVIAKYEIPLEPFHEILAGVEMDLTPRVYRTFEDLRVYCHRVASAVGLVSIEIFGYTNPMCRRYALDLGMALQITNIIRDVGQDLDNGGRIYLPLADLERHGYTEGDLRARVYDPRFVALMEYETDRARVFFHSARVHLPPEDRASMRAAEIMGAVYSRLLRRMKEDRFHVFDKRYSLSRTEKVWVVARAMVRAWMRA
jgi:phytoene synthase